MRAWCLELTKPSLNSEGKARRCAPVGPDDHELEIPYLQVFFQSLKTNEPRYSVICSQTELGGGGSGSPGALNTNCSPAFFFLVPPFLPTSRGGRCLSLRNTQHPQEEGILCSLLSHLPLKLQKSCRYVSCCFLFQTFCPCRVYAF